MQDPHLRLMQSGFETFNRGEFFEAHEHWEEVWDVIDDPERRWVQGLIQIATGLHKLDRGRSDICERLLGRALAKLADAPPALAGIDLEDARNQAKQVVAAIARGELPAARSICLRLASP